MGKDNLDVSDGGLEITDEMIENYLESLSYHGKSAATIAAYRRNLSRLRRFLGEDNKIYRNTLETLRKHMLTDGYAASTVNSFTASVNGFLEFCGCREFQVFETLKCERDLHPEITRKEYLRLLDAARMYGNERIYLMIKVFAFTGVMLSQLNEITVETIRSGKIVSQGSIVHIPSVLCRELLYYADRHTICSGPIFVTRTGHGVDRSNINREIRNLASYAGVPPEKCTPLSLRKLYQATQDSIRSRTEILVQQYTDRLIEQEQIKYGWERPEQAECVVNS